ncbi:MAG: transporter substrate-binding domain-containing protein [Oleispira sp.]
MIRFILLILTIMGSSALYAEKITAVGDPWPPFLDPSQASKGIIAEIATAAYATQGYELETTFVPWARAVAGVKNATFDLLLGTWLTEERTKFLMFSEPYLNNSIKFIKKKGSTFDYSGLESLTGKSVGIVRGYGYGDDFINAKHFKRPEAKNLISNIRKLVAGRIDLTLEDEIVAKTIMAKEQPDLLDKIEFSNTDYSTNALYVTSGLANAKHKELIKAFNKGLTEIRNNGVYDKILNSLNK